MEGRETGAILCCDCWSKEEYVVAVGRASCPHPLPGSFPTLAPVCAHTYRGLSPHELAEVWLVACSIADPGDVCISLLRGNLARVWLGGWQGLVTRLKLLRSQGFGCGHVAARAVGDRSQGVPNMELGLEGQLGPLLVSECGDVVDHCLRGQLLEDSCQSQGRSRGRGNTEAQKTSSVGAGRGGILGYRVDFSKEAFGTEGRDSHMWSRGI